VTSNLPADSQPVGSKVVLFDLDNTLFDHFHSLRQGIRAVCAEYARLSERNEDELIEAYNQCLELAYQAYLENKISYEQKDSEKVRLFFAATGLGTPTAVEIHGFRQIYDSAYLGSRRATPGSVETLARLKENDFRVAIVTDGQIVDQAAKAKTIGVHPYVDRIVTSEEAGAAKPSPHILRLALNAVDADTDESYMVGDSLEKDIKGAIELGLRPVLYAPRSSVSELTCFGARIPVIHRMLQLLDVIGIQQRRFLPTVEEEATYLTVRGLGIDLVTADRHCLRMTGGVITDNIKRMEAILDHIARSEYTIALDHLSYLIESTARAATLIDENKITIAYPGRGAPDQAPATTTCSIKRRAHSVLAEYRSLRLACGPGKAPLIAFTAAMLQQYCDNLMTDQPRESLRNVRSVILRVAQHAGMTGNVVIVGERIEVVASDSAPPEAQL